MPPPRQRRIAVILAILVVALCAALNSYCFQSSYFEPDTVSYLFQANLFAHLHLTAPPPPDRGFSPSVHLNIVNGKWYSLYPFGNALLLSVGVLVGAPWLIPCLATGAAIFVLFRILSHIYEPPHALVGVVIATLSPATIVMGATCFAEVSDRLFLSIYLLGIARMSQWVGYASPLLSGVALGLALNTRPLTAAAFGLAGGVFWLYSLVTASAKAHLYRVALIFVLGFMLGPIFFLCWNYVGTGNPVKATYNADQPYVLLGFGPRSVGNNVDPATAPVYTPWRALDRLLTKSAPAVMVNALGWGYYDPGMDKRLLTGGGSQILLFLRVLPEFLTMILIVIPVLAPSRTRWDVLFFSIVGLNFIFYSFYWFDASTWGFTPAHSRYYTEATTLAIVPLVARALVLVYGHAASQFGNKGRAAFSVALILLFVNSIQNYQRDMDALQKHGSGLHAIDRAVKTQRVHHAVVFVRSTVVPLGDYPFKASREEADVLFYRLGPAPQWQLDSGDWSVAYDHYFAGRSAYLFQGGKLIPVGR